MSEMFHSHFQMQVKKDWMSHVLFTSVCQLLLLFITTPPPPHWLLSVLPGDQLSHFSPNRLLSSPSSSLGGDDGGQQVSRTTFYGNSTLLFFDCPRLVSERFLESVEFRCIFRSFVLTSPRVVGSCGDFRLHRVNFHSFFSRTSWISWFHEK